MEGKIRSLPKVLFFISILVLLVGLTSCNLPDSSGPTNDFQPQENHPEEPPPEEPMHGEEQPPEEPPHEKPAPEQPPQEEPPHEEPAPGGQEDETGSVYGRDPAAAGSIMMIYEGACPSNEEITRGKLDQDGNFRFQGLLPGTYCVGGWITVQVRSGQETEVNFP